MPERKIYRFSLATCDIRLCKLWSKLMDSSNDFITAGYAYKRNKSSAAGINYKNNWW